MVCSGHYFRLWNRTCLFELADKNRRLTKILYKIGVGLVCFFAVKIIASLLDNYFASGIGIYSNLVNNCFWIAFYFMCHKIRKRIASEEVGEVGRNSLAKSFDAILDEMTLKREMLRSLG